MAESFTLRERLNAGMKEFERTHSRWPVVVRCSPAVTAKLIRAAGGPSMVKWDAVDNREDGSHQARFGRQVMQMDWFEDTRLSGESFTFE